MSKKMILLRSTDDETFEVEEHVALMSQTIKHLIEDGCGNDPIPLINMTGNILSKVIEYCKKPAEAAAAGSPDHQSAKIDLEAWDFEFVDAEESIIYDLILAANYLNIRSLLDLACKKVADMIVRKSPEEIREIFGIENDYTLEEEAKFRRKHWGAFGRFVFAY